METAETIESAKAHILQARKKGLTIGFVPTMGALHIGHISLIESARKKTGYVVVSIFVNPTQFGAGEDFEKYPRPIEKDLLVCKDSGVDLVFVPSVGQMCPDENLTWVNVEKLTRTLCGASRPGHFRGVATVCAKLFNIIWPDAAFFGQKDAQQCAVIKRMVKDLKMPLEIVICPTVREADGLAVSSRNQYLTGRQRKDAVCLYKALQQCKKMVQNGETDTETIINKMKEIIEQIPYAQIDYISIVDSGTLQNLKEIDRDALGAIAVWMGKARLIDNIIMDFNK
jgi:pantoate--beta-alanine ligase